MSDENQPIDPLSELESLQAVSEFTERADVLLAEIEVDAQLAERAASEKFMGDDGVMKIRSSIPARVKATAIKFEQDVKEDAQRLKDGLTGEVAHEEFVAQAELDRDANFLQQRGFIEDIVGGHARKWGPQPQRSAPSETLQEVLTANSGFGIKTGAQLFREAETALLAARNEALDSGSREHENQLLERYHGPVCERMTTAPPRHSRSLQPAFRQLHQAITAHLDSNRGGAWARLSAEYSATVLGQFDFATNTVRHTGQFDDFIIGTGAPKLFGPQAEEV